MRPTLGGLLVLLVHGTAAHGQVPIWTRQGTPLPVVTLLNGPLAVIGDVNADGHRDLLTYVSGSIPPQGFWILSGRDGSTLRMQPSFLSPFAYGARTITATGDMNGDGLEDYALGWINSQLNQDIVQVRSAADDSVLWQAYGTWIDMYAWTVAGDLDTDGDGLRDLVVGAQRQNGFTGAIHVYGNNGTLRYTIANQPGLSYLGRSLAKVGDVNSDGCDDFVAGAVGTVGMVVVYSGLTGAELRRGLGDNDGVLGYSVTGCGDMNGDGVPDFAGGTSGGFGDRGMVRVFSGANAATLYSWWSPSTTLYGNGFGKEVFGGVDVNLDGVPDILITNADYDPSVGETLLAAYSGRDGSRIFLHSLTAPAELRATMPPAPGEPFPRYVAWLYHLVGSTDVSRIRMYVSSPPGVESYGVACPGVAPNAPRIGIHGTEQGTTRVHVSGGEPGGFGILLLGLSDTNYLGWPLPFPLAIAGFPGCMLSTSIDAFVIASLGTTGNAAGYASFDLPLPLAAAGLTVHGQWLTLAAGTAASRGVTAALRWRH